MKTIWTENEIQQFSIDQLEENFSMVEDTISALTDEIKKREYIVNRYRTNDGSIITKLEKIFLVLCYKRKSKLHLDTCVYLSKAKGRVSRRSLSARLIRDIINAGYFCKICKPIIAEMLEKEEAQNNA